VVPARGAKTVASAGAGEGGALERSPKKEKVEGVGRRAAKRVDLHDHDHEERGEEDLLVAGHRALRRASSPRPRTGHPSEHRGMGAASEQAKGGWKGGGGGGGGGGGVSTAPRLRACRRGLGGTAPCPHCSQHRPTR